MNSTYSLPTREERALDLQERCQQLSEDIGWLGQFDKENDIYTYESVRRGIEVSIEDIKYRFSLIDALGKVNALPTFSTPIEKPAVFESRNQYRDYPLITPNTRFLGYSPEEVDMLMKRAGLK